MFWNYHTHQEHDFSIILEDNNKITYFWFYKSRETQLHFFISAHLQKVIQPLKNFSDTYFMQAFKVSLTKWDFLSSDVPQNFEPSLIFIKLLRLVISLVWQPFSKLHGKKLLTYYWLIVVLCASRRVTTMCNWKVSAQTSISDRIQYFKSNFQGHESNRNTECTHKFLKTQLNFQFKNVTTNSALESIRMPTTQTGDTGKEPWNQCCHSMLCEGQVSNRHKPQVHKTQLDSSLCFQSWKKLQALCI